MATYAGTGIGLVKEVKGAGEIVDEVRDGLRKVFRVSNEL
jgi:nitronate monooxygenase